MYVPVVGLGVKVSMVKLLIKRMMFSFQIDGFVDVNKDAVDKAREDLAAKIKEIFGVETQMGYVDKNHPEFEWE